MKIQQQTLLVIMSFVYENVDKIDLFIAQDFKKGKTNISASRYQVEK
jgi:hypothetical protein